jgi:hypothetical protein
LVAKLLPKEGLIPKGVYRFKSIQDANEWSIEMMAKNKK